MIKYKHNIATTRILCLSTIQEVIFMLTFHGESRFNQFEQAYVNLVLTVLTKGHQREVRNGGALSMFGVCLGIETTHLNILPLLIGRKMYPKGIIGELATILKGASHIRDFEANGCNYWKQWAKEDGSLELDYGNKWLDFGGVNQLEEVVKSLASDPFGRRHLISAWDPARLPELSLPCCHYAYQWYVREENGIRYLDMIWHQRSADLMVGVPSDIILAVLLNALMANTVGYRPGNVDMVFGDAHVYNEHIDNAWIYLDAAQSKLRQRNRKEIKVAPLPKLATVFNFSPSDIVFTDYEPNEKIDFVLKS